jgi:hypothetical protein
MKDDMKEYKRKQEVRITTLTGDIAEKIEQVLDNNGSGIIIYRKIGPRLIDVYTEIVK